MRPLGDANRLHGPLRIAVAAAGQRSHGNALRLPRDALDRIEVAGRRGREAGLDDVHAKAGELAGDLELLGRGQSRSGCLLAVPEGRVEDPDGARGDARAPYPAHERAPVGDEAWAWLPAAAWAWLPAAACAWPATTVTGFRNAIWARRAAPTCSIWWLRSCARRRSNSWRPESFSAIHRLAKLPSWISRRTWRIVSRTRSSMIRGPLT